ncbi:MAG: hypothetical protein WBA57_21055 [Elainellaceae cyanobacterium]
MPKMISLQSGETVKLFTRSFSSIPTQYRFEARAIGTDELAGTINIVVRQLIFRKPDVTLPLHEMNLIEAGYWDTFVTIYVTAKTDLELIYKQAGLGYVWWIVAIAIVIVIAAIAIFSSGL